jgi:O-antigen/teichoic acid export membrane protein
MKFPILLTSMQRIRFLKNTSLNKFFAKGHERSRKVKVNILTAFLFKSINIAVSLLLVPLTLNYLTPIKYGIWLTLSSIIVWFDFFDIGLGNGLRNKFAEAVTKNDKILARIYVSTTYFILAIIVFVIYLLFLFMRPFLNWPQLLNTPPGMGLELSRLVFFVFTLFCIQFVFKLIGTILIADQKIGISSMFSVISNLLSLVIIYILTKTTSGSLIYLGIAMGMTPVIVLFVANMFFFSSTYREYLPALKFVKLKYARNLAGLGFKFFLIQISAVLIFSSSNIIIAQIFGPAEVTSYNIVFKYFSIITMFFSIILMPFWSAFTEAYHKQDFSWIKINTKKLVKTWIVISIGISVMVVISKFVYRIWVGDAVHISFLLTLLMAFFSIINSWNSIFVSFLNGVGKIKLQLYFGMFVALLNIPLSIFFAKNLKLGNAGVLLATCLSLLPCTILWPVQYRKIVNNQATGIWGK